MYCILRNTGAPNKSPQIIFFQSDLLRNKQAEKTHLVLEPSIFIAVNMFTFLLTRSDYFFIGT